MTPQSVQAPDKVAVEKVERVVVRDRPLEAIVWTPAARPFFEKRQRECPQGDSNP